VQVATPFDAAPTAAIVMGLMSQPIVIRPGRPSDVPSIAVFMLRLAHETEHLRLNPDTVERGVRAAINDPGKGHYFIAEFDGLIAGCLLITHEWSDWRNGDVWWIQSVYVHADFRRRGVFRALHAHVREQARLSGAVAIRLYVERTNDLAKKVYAGLGLSTTGYELMMEDLV
jgi:GNAT superfamily N-acetyltransferase